MAMYQAIPTDAWSGWITTSGTTNSTSGAWFNWNTGTTTATSADWVRWTAITRSPEETQRIQARETQRAAEVQAADRRAHELMLSVLDREGRERFERHGEIIIASRRDPRHRYLLRRGVSANIEVITPDGHCSHRLCAHPPAHLPVPDIMLAQKLWLESHEDEFLRIANRHAVARPGLLLPPMQ